MSEGNSQENNQDKAESPHEEPISGDASNKAEPVLSQEEIDLLLSNVDSKTIDKEKEEKTDPSGVRYRPFDFASQERAVSGRMSGLYAINERFLRNFRTSLMNLLRRTIEITLVDIMTVKTGEYLSSLPEPSCMNIIRLRPLHGTGLCLIDSQLVFALVDCLFGGGDRFVELKAQRVEFTQMEIRIMHLVLELIFTDLSSAWQSIYPLKFEFQSFEINPQLINIASNSEMLIVKRFNIDIEEKIGGEIHIVMPYSMIEPIKATLEAGAQNDSEDINELWAKALREEIFDVRIELMSYLSDLRMSLSQVASLKRGDVLPIELKDFVTVFAAGVPTFRARFGTSRGKRAVKMIGRAQRQ